MVFSSLIAERLPKEPSTWTQETLKWEFGLISIAWFFLVSIMAFLSVLPALLLGAGEVISTLIALIESFALLLSGFLMSRRGDPL
ncbi:MAG: hypothetical protein C0200_07630 [Thermoproteota archaeon]|nr:MAG: hypothetical protein C0200_07630 [Candidatus Korarchaeota archaeon]